MRNRVGTKNDEAKKNSLYRVSQKSCWIVMYIMMLSVIQNMPYGEIQESLESILAEKHQYSLLNSVFENRILLRMEADISGSDRDVTLSRSGFLFLRLPGNGRDFYCLIRISLRGASLCTNISNIEAHSNLTRWSFVLPPPDVSVWQ